MLTRRGGPGGGGGGGGRFLALERRGPRGLLPVYVGRYALADDTYTLARGKLPLAGVRLGTLPTVRSKRSVLNGLERTAGINVTTCTPARGNLALVSVQSVTLPTLSQLGVNFP